MAGHRNPILAAESRLHISKQLLDIITVRPHPGYGGAVSAAGPVERVLVVTTAALADETRRQLPMLKAKHVIAGGPIKHGCGCLCCSRRCRCRTSIAGRNHGFAACSQSSTGRRFSRRHCAVVWPWRSKDDRRVRYPRHNWLWLVKSYGLPAINHHTSRSTEHVESRLSNTPATASKNVFFFFFFFFFVVSSTRSVACVGEGSRLRLCKRAEDAISPGLLTPTSRWPAAGSICVPSWTGRAAASWHTGCPSAWMCRSAWRRCKRPWPSTGSPSVSTVTRAASFTADAFTRAF